MVLLNDMSETVSDANIPWRELRKSSILVTGATGLIGLAIVRTLFAADEKYNLGIRVLAFGRDEEKGVLIKEYGADFRKHDIRELLIVNEKVDYIFHCAAVTNSAEMVSNPVGVIETSIKGVDNVLSFAVKNQVKSVVYLSSMEVYGITDPALSVITENDLGYIDVKKPRSCYPESKRMCELMCNCYFSQYATPVKTARLAQTFGAGAQRDDMRVFAQFARSAMSGENIVLHTEGKSRGNFCYISDAVRGLFLLLLKGENGESYNIANPDASVTIREMAELVAREISGGNISVIVEIPKDIKKRGYAPDVTMRLSSEKIEKLGWKPRYGLVDMYKRTIDFWSYNKV